MANFFNIDKIAAGLARGAAMFGSALAKKEVEKTSSRWNAKL